jgi:hypothetical protein
MGYYIRLDDADWEVKETPEALATIREMPVKYHGIKRGGSSNGEKWFSWMNDTEIENAETVESVFQNLGFETESTDGGFKLIGYDSKTGQEDLFLGVIAPYSVEGSYVEFIGEDDAHYRYEVDNGKMYTMSAEIKWGSKAQYQYYHMQIIAGDGPHEWNNCEVDIYDPVDVAEKCSKAEEIDKQNQEYYASKRDVSKQIADAISLS